VISLWLGCACIAPSGRPAAPRIYSRLPEDILGGALKFFAPARE